MKVFVHYPSGMEQFFQNTMPSGYSEDRVFTYEDGLRSMCNFVFPVKSGGFYGSALTTINRPLRESNVARAEPHYQSTQFKQFKDTDDDDDHVIQQEVLEAYQCSLYEE